MVKSSCISEGEVRLTLSKGGGSRSFMTMNDHDCDHLVTKVRCKDLPDSDRGDFRCWCAVDSSSYSGRYSQRCALFTITRIFLQFPKYERSWKFDKGPGKLLEFYKSLCGNPELYLVEKCSDCHKIKKKHTIEMLGLTCSHPF